MFLKLCPNPLEDHSKFVNCVLNTLIFVILPRWCLWFSKSNIVHWRSGISGIYNTFILKILNYHRLLHVKIPKSDLVWLLCFLSYSTFLNSRLHDFVYVICIIRPLNLYLTSIYDNYDYLYLFGIPILLFETCLIHQHCSLKSRCEITFRKCRYLERINCILFRSELPQLINIIYGTTNKQLVYLSQRLILSTNNLKCVFSGISTIKYNNINCITGVELLYYYLHLVNFGLSSRVNNIIFILRLVLQKRMLFIICKYMTTGYLCKSDDLFCTMLHPPLLSRCRYLRINNTVVIYNFNIDIKHSLFINWNRCG